MIAPFEIAIHIMGDVSDKIIRVSPLENEREFKITMPNGKNSINVQLQDDRNLVQTSGIPLDGNTLHSMSMGIKVALENLHQ